MQHHTRYLDAKEALLDSIENQISAKVQPILEASIEQTVDILEDETAEREAALTPLNDSLQSAIGEVLFMRQREMAELVAQFYPGIPNRMLTPTEWMDTIAMSGFTLNQWFQRKSPSRWMRDILKATPADVRHTVKTAIQHAVWSSAAHTEVFSWQASPMLMWITRPELSATGTCSECSPLNGRKEIRRKDFGVPYPLHPRCMCGIVPVAS